MAQSSVFWKVTHGGVVGLALKRHAVLYTVFNIGKDGDPTIFKVSCKGRKETVFAPTFPSTAGNHECEIEVNPGLGQWDAKVGYVYVTQGDKIYEITPNGLGVTVFVQLSFDPGTSGGTAITFDRVGTFSYDMILTDINGKVYRVNTANQGTKVTPFANVNTTVGDTLAVVPKSLGPYGGQIWVAAESDGKVYSISNNGTVNTVVSVPNAGNVSVIPQKPEELCPSAGAYFAADWSPGAGLIIQYPESAFRGHGGNVLVGQESEGKIFMIEFKGGSYVVTPFDNNAFKGNGEGAAFVYCHHHRDDDDDDDDDDD